jgi:hypothetical protein
MFQYNPAYYSLEESLQLRLTEPWTMYWGRSIAQHSERVYFMQSGGPRAAITAVGRIAVPVYEVPEETNRFQRYWVDVVYDYRVEPPLTRPEMLNDDVLREYGPFARGEFRANFALPPEVVARTERLVRPRQRPIERAREVGHKRVFVSHSHHDNEFGVQLAHDLRIALGGQEESIWFDASGGLHGGDEWWRVIRQEMEQRPIVVVILSPDAMASDFVNRELDMAVLESKQIIPVLHRQCRIRIDLTRLQYVSFMPPTPYEQALQELLQTLGLSI